MGVESEKRSIREGDHKTQGLERRREALRLEHEAIGAMGGEMVEGRGRQ